MNYRFEEPYNEAPYDDLLKFEHAAHKLVFLHFQSYYGVNRCAIAFEHFGESFGLRDSAGESVENHTFSAYLGLVFKKVGQHVNHQVVGYQ